MDYHKQKHRYRAGILLYSIAYIRILYVIKYKILRDIYDIYNAPPQFI